MLLETVSRERKFWRSLRPLPDEEHAWFWKNNAL